MSDIEETAADSESPPPAASQKKARAAVLTKRPKWHDMPIWHSRTDCPLLRMPNEVLDRCFALDTGLSIRDYVALAGVNRLFRGRFDNAVFYEICVHNSLVPADEEAPAPRLSDIPFSSQIFSRDSPDWKVSTRPVPLRQIPGDYYRPRGERRNWSKAQYKVYREERDIHLAAHRLARYRAAFEASQKRVNLTKVPIAHSPVKDGNATRQVIGVVNGQPDGERPFGAKGAPIRASIAHYKETERETRVLRRRIWTSERLNELQTQLETLVLGAEKPATDSDVESYSETSDTETRSSLVDSEAQRRVRGRKRKRRQIRPWIVPSSPDDSDDSVDRFEWEDSGQKKTHDFWPSRYRTLAVESLYGEFINKSVAVETYKVTVGQLATLRHVLATNPLNKATPRRLFLKTAVEALAYRAHGGEKAHFAHVEKMNERISKGRETRNAKKPEGATPAGTKGSVRQPKHWRT